MQENLIKKYFDVMVKIENDVPIFDFKLKSDMKIRNDVPLKYLRPNGQKVCQTGEKYYVHYLGDIGRDVYLLRKKLFSKFNLIKWFIDTYPDTIYKDLLLRHRKILIETSNNQVKVLYASKKGDDLRKRRSDVGKQYADHLRKLQLEKWSNKEYVNFIKSRYDYSYENHGKKVSEFYKNPANKEYIKEVMNHPERLKKISERAKKMWVDLRKENGQKLKNMVTSGFNKNYIVNDIKMNNIEYQIALILNELKLEWKYGKVFNFENKTYVPDFFIENKNIIIEAYGDYYHANPVIFSEKQILYNFRPVVDIWNNDKLRKEAFESRGYIFYNFWESDINKNLNGIKQMIYEYTK